MSDDNGDHVEPQAPEHLVNEKSRRIFGEVAPHLHVRLEDTGQTDPGGTLYYHGDDDGNGPVDGRDGGGNGSAGLTHGRNAQKSVDEDRIQQNV